MKRFVSLPSLPVPVALLACAGLLLWGCSRTVTGPDRAASTAASGALARLVTSDELSISGSRSGGSLAEALRDQPGVEHSLKQITPEVIGTATSMFEGRPVVLALTRRAFRALPGRVAGREVVQFVAGDVNALSYYCGTSTSRADNCGAGTLGAIVTDGTRNYWLSNWHVFVRNFGKVGDGIDAPGRFDTQCGPSHLVGNVSRFTPVRFDGSYNTVDCAIASIAPGTSVSMIEAAGANSFRPTATIATAWVGLPVKKVGRSTGFNTGRVMGLNASLPITYQGIGAANFMGLVMFSKMAEEGDSGSLVCTQPGNNPVALMMAGNSSASYGCPIGAVFQAVGAHIPN
jgi:hypothetical protein